MSAFIYYILYTLALARITRLITLDKITEPARHWLIKKRGRTSKLVYLAHCPWCMSIWVALITTPALLHLTTVSPTTYDWWLMYAITTLATAHIAALLITELESSH